MSHVTEQSDRTVKELSAQMQVLKLDRGEEAMRVKDQLLESLRYDTMNARRSQISESHKGTYEWIFRDKFHRWYDLSDSAESETANSDHSADADDADDAEDAEDYEDYEDYDGYDADDCDGSDGSEDSDDYGGVFKPAISAESTEPVSSDDSDESGDDIEPDEPDEPDHAEHCSNNFLGFLRNPDEKLYWINGKAGSGKSTLLKFLYDDPRTKKILGENSTGIFFAFHFIWPLPQAEAFSRMYGPIVGPKLFSDLIEAYRQLDLHPLGMIIWNRHRDRSLPEMYMERPVDSMIGHSNETKETPKLLAIEAAEPFGLSQDRLFTRRYWRIKDFAGINELEYLLSKCYEDENFNLDHDDLTTLLAKHKKQGNLEEMSLEEWIALLIERDHAFRITPENPWPPPMFEDNDADGDEQRDGVMVGGDGTPSGLQKSNHNSETEGI
ncbi:hypothetical protein C8034_v006334 [Colletotrichum sidae]|uniref:Nephrocystin 3-like N-terminal domain-containing protein n=1 Tax=Colletotrichum sidae TaxID=1347389 RepID=A0A4R8TTI6_9PEZI|nr:hypothetical protein C8034_v006334 [Colletotrichum sidae]